MMTIKAKNFMLGKACDERTKPTKTEKYDNNNYSSIQQIERYVATGLKP